MAQRSMNITHRPVGLIADASDLEALVRGAILLRVHAGDPVAANQLHCLHLRMVSHLHGSWWTHLANERYETVCRQFTADGAHSAAQAYDVARVARMNKAAARAAT